MQRIPARKFSRWVAFYVLEGEEAAQGNMAASVMTRHRHPRLKL